MADFPSLEPSARAFGLGNTSQIRHEAASGIDVRFVSGSDRVLQTLKLDYEYLQESEAQQILDHFYEQQGNLISFDLPSIIWTGYTTPPVSSSDYKWRYSAELSVSIAAPQRYNITAELETIPI